EAVDDIQYHAQTDHDNSDGDGAVHEAHGVALQRIMPEGIFLEGLDAETAPIDHPENHARQPEGAQEHTDIAGLLRLSPKERRYSQGSQKGTLTPISEHHTEHEHVADGDED